MAYSYQITGSDIIFKSTSSDVNINLNPELGKILHIKSNISSNNTYGIITTSGLTQTIANNALTKLEVYWNSSGTITGNDISNLTYLNGEFTVKKTGTYFISFNASFSANGNGARSFMILINGDTALDKRYGYINLIPNTVDRCSGSTSIAIQLNQGDTIGTYVFQSSGSNLNMNTVIDAFFMVYRLG